MSLLLTILMHLIPISMILTICLSLIFLMILPRLPGRAVMTLLTVWLGLRLKLNAVAVWPKRHGALSPLR